MSTKHKAEWVADDKRPVYKHGESTPLDKALKRYAYLGERVLDFYRNNGGWTFVVMA